MRILFLIITFVFVNVFACLGQKKAMRSVSTTQAIERTVLTVTLEGQTQRTFDKTSEKNDEHLAVVQPQQVSEDEKRVIKQDVYYIKSLYKEKGLNESIYMQAYTNIIRELMQSELESDWIYLSHANEVMRHLLKNKCKINKEDVANDLRAANSVKAKIIVFEKYYGLLK